MFILHLFLVGIHLNSQNLTVSDVRACNFQLNPLNQTFSRYYQTGNAIYSISSSFFYGLISFLPSTVVSGGAVYVYRASGSSLVISSSIFGRCGTKYGNGGAIYFYGEYGIFEQIIGVDCQCYYYSGQIIYAKISNNGQDSNGRYLKLIQSTVFRCPGEEKYRIFLLDYNTLDSIYLDSFSNIASGPENYMLIEVASSNISDNRNLKSNSAIRATDALTISVHHTIFNNLHHSMSYVNGLLHLEDGYNTYFNDCNFINSSVDSYQGALVTLYDQEDLDDSYWVGRIYTVGGFGKYLFYETYLSRFIHIIDYIYVYDYEFDRTDINWSNYLIIVENATTINLDSSVRNAFEGIRIVKIYSEDYIPDYRDDPCFITGSFTNSKSFSPSRLFSASGSFSPNPTATATENIIPPDSQKSGSISSSVTAIIVIAAVVVVILLAAIGFFLYQKFNGQSNLDRYKDADADTNIDI
jgi:hypothetical protein